jgi:hypothetical protein
MTPFTAFVNDNIKNELRPEPAENLVGVEIGVFKGTNANYLLQDLNIEKLYLVDNYKPYWDGGSEHYAQDFMNGCHESTLKMAEGHFSKVMMVVQESEWASKLFNDNYFDFVYIDANHDYKSVMRDMYLWWPKTKSGGVFGGHDYGTVNGAEVKRAVDDFLKEKGIPIKDPSIGMRVGQAMEWAFIKQ